MHIYIRDNMDLYKIIHSGQCFRAAEIENNLYRFITGRHILYISPIHGIRYDVSCSRYQWNHVWKPYLIYPQITENWKKP